MKPKKAVMLTQEQLEALETHFRKVQSKLENRIYEMENKRQRAIDLVNALCDARLN